MDVDSALRYAGRHELHTLVVATPAAIVAERYGTGWDPRTPHALYSGTKSFWGITALAAAEDGLLELDEPVAQTIAEWTGDGHKATVTIRQLLNLTSGYGFGGLGTAVPTAAKAIATPLKHDPGTTFTYGGVPLQVFGEVLRRKLSSRATTPHAYLRERILEPAGVRIDSWRMLRDGTHTLPTGAFIEAHAWLAYGRMLLAGGRAGGTQIVRASSLRECVSGSVQNPRYGLGFWLDPLDADDGVFYASGAGGQALYVIPQHDAVVVHFGKSTSWKHATFLRALLGASSAPVQSGCV
ncbi:MAG: serine hydrolase domain-containing protein [Candidatus Velthaea sp.]